MTDDLVKRLRFGVALDEQGDVSWCNQEAMHNAADRIEQLELALREIACDGEDCHCQAPQYCSYGIARLALGEKKDDSPCSNEDGDDMCLKCNCWKHTRAMCG